MPHDTELWQAYAPNGEPIKGVGHPGPYYLETLPPKAICGTSSVWLYRDAPTGRELLFQKRSATVRANPNKWSVSVSGHINLGESSLAAAVREVKEELDVDIAPDGLKLAFSYFNQEVHAFNWTYLYDLTGDKNAFHFADHEVSKIRWVPLSQVSDFAAKNVIHGLTAMKWYWDLLLNYRLKFL